MAEIVSTFIPLAVGSVFKKILGFVTANVYPRLIHVMEDAGTKQNGLVGVFVSVRMSHAMKCVTMIRWMEIILISMRIIETFKFIAPKKTTVQ